MWTIWPQVVREIQAGQVDHALPILLGRILERTEGHSREIGGLDTRVTVLEKEHEQEYIPRWERSLKRWLAYLLPLAVALGTGSIDGAIRLLEAMK